MKPIPDYGDHMTLREFIDNVESGGFIGYDGFGKYATATEMSDTIVYPSDVQVFDAHDRKWTHVV